MLCFIGNVGGSFAIQPQLGTLSVAKPLNQQVLPEYYLVVRASDHGTPSLNSTVTVHIKGENSFIDASIVAGNIRNLCDLTSLQQ